MKKIFFALTSLVLCLSSCSSDTKSYAELVDSEKSYISRFLGMEGINVIEMDDERLSSITKSVLSDSVPPSRLIRKGQWYTFSDGYFKRLYFRINNWGKAGDAYIAYRDSLDNGLQPKVVRRFKDAKFRTGSYAEVRYDSLYSLTDEVNIHKDLPSDNLAPYEYEIVMNWSESYYAMPSYGMYYNSNKAYECTSGGLAFPLRFLWYGGEASLIVPFSLVSSDLSSYYFTLYYGKVTYTNPSFLPE